MIPVSMQDQYLTLILSNLLINMDRRRILIIDITNGQPKDPIDNRYALCITLSTLKNTDIPHFFKC